MTEYYRTKKHTIKDAQLLAKGKDGFCLSIKYKGANNKLKWKCEKGHIWKASYTDITQGYWCPNCYGNIVRPIKEIKEIN